MLAGYKWDISKHCLGHLHWFWVGLGDLCTGNEIFKSANFRNQKSASNSKLSQASSSWIHTSQTFLPVVKTCICWYCVKNLLKVVHQNLSGSLHFHRILASNSIACAALWAAVVHGSDYQQDRFVLNALRISGAFQLLATSALGRVNSAVGSGTFLAGSWPLQPFCLPHLCIA